MAKVHQIFVIISLFFALGYCKKCTFGDNEIDVPEDMDCNSFTPVIKKPHNVVSEVHADKITVGIVNGNARPLFWDGFPFPPNSKFPPRFPGIGWPSHWFRPNRRRRPRPRPDQDIEECPDEGVKFISHPTNCEKYILCVNGDEVAELTCQNNWHFSRETRQCEHPIIAECEAFDFECDPDSTAIQFIPDVTDCNAYFVCFGGNQVPMRCGPGLHWSLENNQCMDPNIAGCPWEDRDEIMMPFALNGLPPGFPPNLIPPNFIPPSNGNGNNVTPASRCPPTGFHQIPMPGNCEQFIICFNGVEMPRDCPPGLHFCQDNEICLPPEIANCGPGCPSTGVAFLPHEDDCNLYYICFGGNAHIMRCPGDNHWSTDNNQCMDPLEAGCKDQDFECPPTGIEQIPYPYDCERFVFCVNGNEIPLSCAPGLHFCPVLRICTAPEIAQCEERQRGCPEEDDPFNIVFLPNEEDCNRYYLCWGGNQIPMSCPPGNHWSVANNACMHPDDAECVFGFECPETGVENLPHPDSCSKFILCVNGQELERTCPGDLHFSPHTRSCIHPDLAGCEGWECPDTGVTFIPNPEDCSSYYFCFNGQEIAMRCGGNMHWSILDQTCMHPNDANCPFSEDAEEPMIEEETCPPEGVKAIAHPTSCRQYILCINGAEMTRDCPTSTEFSIETRTCVHPLVAQCAAKFTPFSSSTETCPSVTSIQEIAFRPNPQDCESYFLCMPNDTVTMRCGEGFHWNANKRQCMTQDQAHCRA